MNSTDTMNTTDTIESCLPDNKYIKNYGVSYFAKHRLNPNVLCITSANEHYDIIRRDLELLILTPNGLNPDQLQKILIDNNIKVDSMDKGKSFPYMEWLFAGRFDENEAYGLVMSQRKNVLKQGFSTYINLDVDTSKEAVANESFKTKFADIAKILSNYIALQTTQLENKN